MTESVETRTSISITQKACISKAEGPLLENKEILRSLFGEPHTYKEAKTIFSFPVLGRVAYAYGDFLLVERGISKVLYHKLFTRE